MTPDDDLLPTTEAIAQRLRERLAPAFLEVLDESAAHAGHVGAHPSGRGTHFRVRLGGDAMARLTRVQRHRLVYDALQDFLDQGLHALAIEIVPVLTESNT
jgi:BolA protein